MSSQFQMLPIEQLRPSTTLSQTERRKYFDKAKLEDLAASIATRGVVQPIVVRHVPSESSAGVTMPAYYEIVAGERRYVASQIAKRTEIPAVILDLDDRGVIEVQLIENLQREDVHPMQEAEGYHELVHRYGHAVEEIHDRVGKSRSYVYGRLKLLSLSPKARKAFYEGLLSASVAEKLARVPVQKLQDEALPELTGTKWRDGQPLSFRDAVEYIEDNLMLELKSAPFDTADPDLNGAGPCSSCPKRTGNAPDLFGDLKNGDICTDKLCYEAKARAWGQREIARAKKSGVTVLTGQEAKRIAPSGIERDDPYLQGGYHSLKGQVWNGSKYAPVTSMLKPGVKAALLHDGKSGRVIEVVHSSQLEKPKQSSAGGGPSSDSAARKKAELENKFRRAVYDAIRPKLGRPSDHELARAAYNALDAELQKLVWQVRGVEVIKSKHGIFDRDKHDAMIDELAAGVEIASFMNDCIYAPTLRTNTWSSDKTPKRLLDAATRVGVDTAKIRRELAAKKKPKVKAAGKKAKR